MIFLYNFLQRSTEITYQRAADTSGIHLTNLNTCILQETAVNTNLTKLILDQYYLLAFKSLFQKLLDQCCFTGSKETGDNVNLYHFVFPLSILRGTRFASSEFFFKKFQECFIRHRDFRITCFDQEA